MKKQFFRAIPVRRIVNRFILTAFVVAAGFATQAQTAQVKEPIAVSTASVTYIGTDEDLLSVAVKYDNAPGYPFTVTVKDQEGYLLYRGNFRDRKFSKIFQLPKAEVSKVRFEIRNATTKELQSFEINTRTVEEVAIKRVG